MRRVLCVICLLALTGLSAFSQTDDTYDLELIISELHSIGAPFIKGNYIVFTARARSRHVGISFDFEQFRVIHSYQRIDTNDMDGKIIDSIYFYALKIPPRVDSVSYKIITDGLWSVDPLNADTKFDPVSNSVLSTVRIYRDTAPVTQVAQQGLVHFVYTGQGGQKIQIGGSFTNWDPFIYEMRETAPGFYEFYLPLLPGTYYYNFYTGMTAIIDPTNPMRAYTQDGRTASVLQIK
jgi:hypothetical protein